MARRTLFWHLGPSDPGTAFLADALRLHRDDLGALDVHLPEGSWPEVEEQVWSHKGLSLLSTPDAARAGSETAALRLAGLRDVDVHLVLLVRDLPAQVFAGWEAAIRTGSTTPLGTYAARVLDRDRSHWQAEEFWAGRDLCDFLPRWTRAIHPDRVHVVAAPADPEGMRDAFLGVAGIGGLGPSGVAPASSRRAGLDTGRVLDITTAWAKLVAERGFDLRGSLIAPSVASPVAVTREEQFEAVAELLAASTREVEQLSREVVRLRIENARLDRRRRKYKRRLAALAAGGR